MLSSSTNFICNTTTGECFTISQDYLNYINDIVVDWQPLIEKQFLIQGVISSLILFFLLMIVLKLYFANKKW